MLTEPKITITEATIAAGGKQSSAIEIEGARHLGLVIPSVWAAAAITFLASHNGTDYVALYKDEGTEVTTSVTVSTAIGLNTYEPVLSPWQYIKIRSGTAASEVAQPGPKATVALAPETLKTLTFTSGVGGSASNDITVSITIAEDDTLALSKSGNAVTVALAIATGASNSAANIQTALRALSTVGDVDVSAATVTGNTAYNNAPSTGATAGTEAEVELTPAEGKVLTVGSGYAGSNYNDLSFAMDTATDDVLAVAESGGVITISLAKTTASNNAASAIQTAVRNLSVSGYVMTAFTVAGNTAYDSSPPITADVDATAMTDGDEVAVAATNLADGDLTRIQVVAKG